MESAAVARRVPRCAGAKTGPRDPGKSGSNKSWFAVLPAAVHLRPGVYSYIALRNRVIAAGGWDITDRWGAGSYQGYCEQEAATRRAVQAGLVAEDGVVPTFYR